MTLWAKIPVVSPDPLMSRSPAAGGFARIMVPSWHCSARSLVVSPHAQHMDHMIVGEDLIDEPMLDGDAP